MLYEILKELINTSDAATHLGVTENKIKKMKVRYRGSNGHLIKEDVFLDHRDALRVLGIENVTHNKSRKMTRGHVKVYVPSRQGVRTFSTKGKCLTVIKS